MKSYKLFKLLESALNEDKFSSMTLTEIFDELGPDDFSDYLEELVMKAAKGSNIKELKSLELDIKKCEKGRVFFRFYSKEDWLSISYDIEARNAVIGAWWRDERGSLKDMTDAFIIKPDMTNIISQVQKGINKVWTDLIYFKKRSSESK